MCLSAGRTKATLVEPVTPNTQNMTAASVRFSRQCGRCCSVQSQNGLNRDGDGGGGGGGVPVLSNRPNGGRCGWTAVGRRLKAQTGRRASCMDLSSIVGRSWGLPTGRFWATQIASRKRGWKGLVDNFVRSFPLLRAPTLVNR